MTILRRARAVAHLALLSFLGMSSPSTGQLYRLNRRSVSSVWHHGSLTFARGDLD